MTHRLRTNALMGPESMRTHWSTCDFMYASCVTVLCALVLAYPSDMSRHAASGPGYLFFFLATLLTCISPSSAPLTLTLMFFFCFLWSVFFYLVCLVSRTMTGMLYEFKSICWVSVEETNCCDISEKNLKNHWPILLWGILIRYTFEGITKWQSLV